MNIIQLLPSGGSTENKLHVEACIITNIIVIIENQMNNETENNMKTEFKKRFICMILNISVRDSL